MSIRNNLHVILLLLTLSLKNIFTTFLKLHPLLHLNEIVLISFILNPHIRVVLDNFYQKVFLVPKKMYEKILAYNC